MKNKLHFDIPKKSNVDVIRKHDLKNSIFTRTRIALLCLVLLTALCITGTLAYLTWTSNQTPNRVTDGDLEMHIVENTTLSSTTTESIDSGATFTAGLGAKKVKVRSGDDVNRVNELVRVTFLPVVKSKTYSTANVAFGETWSEVKTDSSSNAYIETSLVKLYINPNWATNWTYADGTFTYKTSLERGADTEELLYGVTMADGVSASDYSSVQVKVIADSIQEGTSDTWYDGAVNASTSA